MKPLGRAVLVLAPLALIFAGLSSVAGTGWGLLAVGGLGWIDISMHAHRGGGTS